MTRRDPPRRILIATATAGGGHLAAAAAIEEAWRTKRPADAIRRVDILDYTPRLYRKVYAEGYVKLAETAPELYAHAFRKTDSVAFIKKAARFRRLSARLMARGFLRLVETFKPDLLIAPHFMPLEAIGTFRGSPRPRVAAVVTDFEAHALWMEPSVDLYCVASDETKARLVSRGIESPRVTVTGIPVSTRFLHRQAPATLRRRFGMTAPSPVLLVLGGGLGMGPLVETMRAIDRLEQPFQAMVVAGRNEVLQKRLRAQRFRHPVQVFGFVSNMEELMGASDMVITKPGGLTSSEALAMGKPMIIVNPLPGQEAANSDYLLERGAAIKANHLDDLPFRVKSLLAAEMRSRLARAAKKNGRPHAAMAVCRAAFSLIKNCVVVGLFLNLKCGAHAAAALKADESVIFYPSAAAIRDDGRWEVPLKGWVFERKTDQAVQHLLLRGLRKALRLPESALGNPFFRERGSYFVVDNERGKWVTVAIGEQRFRLSPSNEAGRIDDRVAYVGTTSTTSISRVMMRVEEMPGFSTQIYQIPAEGLSIVSDIDDTIKISNVLDHSKMLARTFLEPYEAVPDMARAYQSWAKEGAAFHYVSGSPSPLYPGLAMFLQEAGFPDGTVTLRPFRPKSREIFSLNQSARDYKIRVIEELLKRFPRRQFILVGDSGEQDPETYGELARRHLPQIRMIAIRQIREQESATRMSKAFEHLPAGRWILFQHPSEMFDRATLSGSGAQLQEKS